MADAAEVQVFIDQHHQDCVRALQRIALLADTGSDVHKAVFGDFRNSTSGWMVASEMRNVANAVVGNIPLNHGKV